MGALRWLRDVASAFTTSNARYSDDIWEFLGGKNIKNIREFQKVSSQLVDAAKKANKVQGNGLAGLEQKIRTIANGTGKEIDEIRNMASDELLNLVSSNKTAKRGGMLKIVQGLGDGTFSGEAVKIHNDAFADFSKVQKNFENANAQFMARYGSMPNVGKHSDIAIGLNDLYGEQQIGKTINSTTTESMDVITQTQRAGTTKDKLRKFKLEKITDGESGDIRYRKANYDEVGKNILTDSDGNEIWEDINEKAYERLSTPGSTGGAKKRIIVHPDTKNATSQVSESIAYDGDIPFGPTNGPINFREQVNIARTRTQIARNAENKQIAAAIAQAKAGEASGGIIGLIQEHPFISMGIAAGGAALLTKRRDERQGNY